MLQWPAANVFKPLQGCFKASAAGVFKRLRRVFIKVAPLSGYLKDYLFGGLIELQASYVADSSHSLSRDDVSALWSVCLSGYEHVAPSAGCFT